MCVYINSKNRNLFVDRPILIYMPAKHSAL